MDTILFYFTIFRYSIFSWKVPSSAIHARVNFHKESKEFRIKNFDTGKMCYLSDEVRK
jgi:hypothetical protein